MQRRFGILSFGTSLGELARTWREAEELGFDSAWVADSLSLRGIADYEAWTSLAALAGRTSRLRIGTLITQIPFRHPALLAAQAITVDHLSGGRLELGIGAGDYAADHLAVGVPVWPLEERMGRLEEQLLILDPLLRGRRVDHKGRYYSSEGLQLPEPLQRPRPPLVIAAQLPQSLRLVARFADAWNTLGGQPLVKSGRAALPLAEAAARTQSQAAMLDDYCRELGRDTTTIRRSVLPYRSEVDPLSSLDAFDEFVGRYSDVGMREFIFYWPPVANARRKQAVSDSQRASFRQIAEQRVAARVRGNS